MDMSIWIISWSVVHLIILFDNILIWYQDRLYLFQCHVNDKQPLFDGRRTKYTEYLIYLPAMFTTLYPPSQRVPFSSWRISIHSSHWNERPLLLLWKQWTLPVLVSRDCTEVVQCRRVQCSSSLQRRALCQRHQRRICFDHGQFHFMLTFLNWSVRRPNLAIRIDELFCAE